MEIRHGLRRDYVAGLDDELATLGHGIAPIDRHVDDRALELARIDFG